VFVDDPDVQFSWVRVTAFGTRRLKEATVADIPPETGPEARIPDFCLSGDIRGPFSATASVDLLLGEGCDDGNTQSGDGCRADCLAAERCGSGLLDAGEQCDDGNTLDGDGCSSQCQVEPGHFFEVEPNDDGTPEAGVEDFSSANANGPFGANVIIHGALVPG